MLRGSLFIGVLIVSLRAWADTPEVRFGPADSFAIDQPSVSFELRERSDPPGSGTVVGPLGDPDLGLGLFRPLQDTGANGILVAGLGYFDPDVLGTNPSLYGVVGQYEEQGVAGTELLDLFELYDLAFVGSDDDPGQPHVVPDVRALGDSSLEIGSFSAIVGMPSMIDRVTVWDLTPLGDAGLFESLGVSAPSTSPPTTPDSYHVDLRLVDFDPTAGQVNPGDPPPTFAPLPFIDGVTTSSNDIPVSSAVLLDSGAQLSIIAESTANAHGINFTELVVNGGDVVEFVDVGGIGGTVQMPVVFLDEWTIPTTEGVGLTWTNVAVGVLDIPGIGGVAGMNLLTSGYASALFGTPSVDDILDFPEILDLLVELDLLDLGQPLEQQIQDLVDDEFLAGAPFPYIERVVLDFTIGPEFGLMRLDLNPAVNVVIPEPAIGLVVIMGFLASVRRWRGAGCGANRT